jgi:RNA polymerase sigma factor (sigma-70 family)
LAQAARITVDSFQDKTTENATAIDEQLLPYLNSANQSESEEHLNRLFDKARPIVYRIARSVRVSVRTVAPFNSHDIFGEVCLRLLQGLRAFKNNPSQHSISNFSGLVATTTSSVFADFMRGKDRRRRSLYQKIRRLIAANPDLATWKDSDGAIVCGYAAWHSTSVNPSAVPSQLRLDFQSDQFHESHKLNTGELILLVLNNVGHPVKFDEFVDLVNIASAGVQVQTVNIDDEHFVQSSPLASYQPDFISAIENQRLLNKLFAEIGKLRVEQRKSLLLNMSDSYGFGIEWFLFARIATEEHLASLLEVSIEQFRKMLKDLPMSDAEIAKELGVSESKVMNMRRAVRERLERRRRSFLGGSSDFMRLK